MNAALQRVVIDHHHHQQLQQQQQQQQTGGEFTLVYIRIIPSISY